VLAVGIGSDFVLRPASEAVDLETAFLVGLTDFLTLTVPYYCLCDYELIDAITCKHLL
jgi:hypothetical protein